MHQSVVLHGGSCILVWKIIPIKLFAQPVQKSWMLRLHVNNLQNFLLHRRTESESQRRRKHFKLHLRRFHPPHFFPSSPLFFFFSPKGLKLPRPSADQMQTFISIRTDVPTSSSSSSSSSLEARAQRSATGKALVFKESQREMERDGEKKKKVSGQQT